VERITFHPDGKRPETDTDHTVMLGVVACAFADKYLPWLNTGLIAQFALLHDLSEAYAGDTPTLWITPEEREAKRQREQAAIDRIDDEFTDQFPWVGDWLISYEHQASAEARYVKAMDKLLPKVTHILNKGCAFEHADMDAVQLMQRYGQQLDELKQYAYDFPPLFELRDQLVSTVLDLYLAKESTSS
jgi:putative hydrolase of HD superfamily